MRKWGPGKDRLAQDYSVNSWQSQDLAAVAFLRGPHTDTHTWDNKGNHVWSLGVEETERSHPELESGCICQNESVTSFIQQRTV